MLHKLEASVGIEVLCCQHYQGVYITGSQDYSWVRIGVLISCDDIQESDMHLQGWKVDQAGQVWPIIASNVGVMCRSNSQVSEILLG